MEAVERLDTRLRRKLSMTSPLAKANHKEITNVYKECVMVNLRTRKRHHVDHIVPLCGETVSGLHVPWNLQIIRRELNLRKGNSFAAAA